MKNYKRAIALFVMTMIIGVIAGCGKSSQNQPGVGSTGAFSIYGGLGAPVGGSGCATVPATGTTTSFNVNGPMIPNGLTGFSTNAALGGGGAVPGANYYFRTNVYGDRIDLNIVSNTSISGTVTLSPETVSTVLIYGGGCIQGLQIQNATITTNQTQVGTLLPGVFRLITGGQPISM